VKLRYLTLRGRHLAYVDTGGHGPALLALHGHFGRARMWDRLAAALAPRWRFVALDQRGHGRSGPAADYDRAGYVADVAHAIEALRLAPAVVLGHSLGGINAYQHAAGHPEQVRAVIVVDAPAEIAAREDVLYDLPRRFDSFRALREAVPDPYLWESAFEDDDGWGLRFDAEQINRSRRLQTGDHWADWLAGEHPVLLLRGCESDFLPRDQARAMVKRRANTRLVEFPGAGHHIYDDDPEGFALAVASFLEEV
jgi:pimeloyl-ACP methyl ester carboxylesterase